MKVLRIPPAVFMPIIAVLCVIGSYVLGTKVFTWPVALILFLVIVLTVLSQVPWYRRLMKRLGAKLKRTPS